MDLNIIIFAQILLLNFRTFRKRRLGVHRSKRDAFVYNSQNLSLNENEKGTEENGIKEFEDSNGAAIGCPSAKYFVHPRVAFSVRGRISSLSDSLLREKLYVIKYNKITTF